MLGLGLGLLRKARGFAKKTIDNAIYPAFHAHRGNADIYPENSSTAYSRVATDGDKNIWLEMDVRINADNSLVLMHDESVARTTDGTGNVQDLTDAQWNALLIDPANFNRPGFPNTRPPYFEEILDTYGGKVLMTAEAKVNGAAQLMVDMIVSKGLERSIIISSNSYADRTPCLNAGIEYMLQGPQETPATLVADGLNYVALDAAETDATIQSYIDAGLRVVVWNIDTREERDHYLSMGVDVISSDEAVWLYEAPKLQLTEDPFENEWLYHGQFWYRDKGAIASEKFGWPTDTNGLYYSAMQGFLGDLSNRSSYKITLDMTHDTISGDTSRWANIFMCAPKEIIFKDDGSAEQNGYFILVRSTGRIELYSQVNGGSTKIGQVDTTALVQGTPITLEIEITTTNIKVTRTDVASTSIDVANTDNRGGLVYFGRNGVGATFSNVSVSDV